MNGLNMDTVATLSASLTTHKSWIRHYKPTLVDLNNNDVSGDNVSIEIAQVTRQTHGSVIGDAPPPTGKEIAALIFKDNPETRAQIFVYTFPRAGPDNLCRRPRFVPLWSPAYEPLQYSLLFPTENPARVLAAAERFRSRNHEHFYSQVTNMLRYFFMRGNALYARKFSKNCLSLAKSAHVISIRAKKKTNYPSLGRRSAKNELQHIAPLSTPLVTHPQVNASRRLFTHLLLTEKKDSYDAMSVVARKGKPHLSVTMACNGNWPEIQDNLLSGQCALDRPDLCNRVFRVKLKALMHDLTHNNSAKPNIS